MAEIPLVPTVPISNTPYQAPLTPSTATQTLNKYGIDPNQVLSAGNIQQTITNPAPAPDDLLGIRSSLYNTTGVNAAQAEYQAARQAASSAAIGLNERLTGLRGRAVSLNKITGTSAQERAVSSNEIDALNAAEQLSLGNYQAKKSEADAQFAIRESEVTQKRALQAQYPGAKISVADSFDQAFTKIDKYAEDQKKEIYKATLKAKAIDLGIKTSGNTKQLEKRISKTNKAALADVKKKSDLELVKLQADIDNIKSEIANRGKADKAGVVSTGGLEKDSDGKVWNVVRDKNTGEIISMEEFKGPTSGQPGTAGKIGSGLARFGGAAITSAAMAPALVTEKFLNPTPAGGVSGPVQKNFNDLWSWVWD